MNRYQVIAVGLFTFFLTASATATENPPEQPAEGLSDERPAKDLSEEALVVELSLLPNATMVLPNKEKAETGKKRGAAGLAGRFGVGPRFSPTFFGLLEIGYQPMIASFLTANGTLSQWKIGPGMYWQPLFNEKPALVVNLGLSTGAVFLERGLLRIDSKEVIFPAKTGFYGELAARFGRAFASSLSSKELERRSAIRLKTAALGFQLACVESIPQTDSEKLTCQRYKRELLLAAGSSHACDQSANINEADIDPDTTTPEERQDHVLEAIAHADCRISKSQPSGNAMAVGAELRLGGMHSQYFSQMYGGLGLVMVF